MITALGGGVGAAKFLSGLTQVVSPEKLKVIINTGDDIDVYGFRVSPDIDTIIYRLSKNVDIKKSWGIKDDTFNCLESLSNLGFETWFRIGDKDFATHKLKSHLQLRGFSPSETTKEVARRFGLTEITLIPMTEDKVETWINTDIGEIHFQEYYIKHKMEPEVYGINIKGIRDAGPAPKVINSILNAELVIICPSNPIISIGPILKVKGIREALISSDAKKIAVSPLIAGKPLKGPTDRLMKGLGLEVSSIEIAKIYKDFLDIMVLDESDRSITENIEELGIKTLVTNTVIPDDSTSLRLSKSILNFVDYL